MKLAICILAHHKPWLIMSSLISLAMQKNNNYDLHIIYIRGNGECRDFDGYKEFYEANSDTLYDYSMGQILEYTKLAKDRGINWAQL